MDNDCWLEVIKYIDKASDLLSLLSTCRQLWNLYNGKLLDKYVDIGYGYTTSEMIGSRYHGLLLYYDHVQYYDRGIRSSQYPIQYAQRNYLTNYGIRYIFNIVDYKIHGDYVRVIKNRHVDYILISCFNSGEYKYSVKYDISNNTIHILRNRFHYYYKVIEERGIVTDDISDIVNGSSDNHWTIKIYDTWVNIKR